MPGRATSFRARVSSEVRPQFDGYSQSVKLRLEVDNPRFVLRPEMFVDVDLLVTLPPWQIDKLVSLRQPVEEYAAANFDVELPPPQRKRRTPVFPMPEIQ